MPRAGEASGSGLFFSIIMPIQPVGSNKDAGSKFQLECAAEIGLALGNNADDKAEDL
jgi:hypothetical protein